LLGWDCFGYQANDACDFRVAGEVTDATMQMKLKLESDNVVRGVKAVYFASVPEQGFVNPFVFPGKRAPRHLDRAIGYNLLVAWFGRLS
jgi:hypothetical protein